MVTTEDEYSPSPSASPSRKRPARSQSTSPSRRSIASVPLSPSPSTPSSHRSKRFRTSTSPQSVQTSLEDESGNERKKEDFICHICSWIQKNSRVPDLERHIITHGQSQWLCCGAPLGTRAADRFMVRRPILVEKTRFRHCDTELVVGCQTLFSRRDTLKRHLDNRHIGCIGGILWFAQNLKGSEEKPKKTKTKGRKAKV
jgi:hypothetical protein